jgi:hypothetical protein
VQSQFSVNWRPQLLVLAKPQKQWDVEGDQNTDNEILSFASQLKKVRASVLRVARSCGCS